MNNNISISLLVDDQLCCYVIRNILGDLDKSELTGMVKLTQYFKYVRISKLTVVVKSIYNISNV